MYVISFSSAKVIEFEDATAFERRAGRWLTFREGENFYLLCMLPGVDRKKDPSIRLFTVEEEGIILAAGMLLPGGHLCMTWATAELIEIVADYTARQRWQIASTYAPAHTSWQMAKAFSDRVAKGFEFLRADRLYQLAYPTFSLPEGRLEVAHASDKPLVSRWFEAFAQETHMEGEKADLQAAPASLVESRRMYLWKTPEPVAMAAWVTSSPNGACMNYVYVPPEYRRMGHGKAISTALAAQMLASGSRYCFILADVKDTRANQMYQSIGARTLSEMLNCRIVTRSAAAANMSEARG